LHQLFEVESGKGLSLIMKDPLGQYSFLRGFNVGGGEGGWKYTLFFPDGLSYSRIFFMTNPKVLFIFYFRDVLINFIFPLYNTVFTIIFSECSVVIQCCRNVMLLY
jgi:hypothetical protein